MKLRENIQHIFKVLSNDEVLLRLLYYKADNLGDDVLIETVDRPNILDMPSEQRWNIAMDRIKFTPKTSDLDNEQKCRLLVYPSRRRSTGNYYVSNQNIIADVLVHESFESDFRLEWICDHVSELLFNKHITAGLGKMDFIEGEGIRSPEGYIGYRLVYNFGSAK